MHIINSHKNFVNVQSIVFLPLNFLRKKSPIVVN